MYLLITRDTESGCHPCGSRTDTPGGGDCPAFVGFHCFGLGLPLGCGGKSESSHSSSFRRHVNCQVYLTWQVKINRGSLLLRFSYGEGFAGLGSVALNVQATLSNTRQGVAWRYHFHTGYPNLWLSGISAGPRGDSAHFAVSWMACPSCAADPHPALAIPHSRNGITSGSGSSRFGMHWQRLPFKNRLGP
jgi:hypothetical protein